MIVDGRGGSLEGQQKATLIGSASRDGTTVLVQVASVRVTPSVGHLQFGDGGQFKVVGIVERGAIAVLLERRLVPLLLVPVAGILFEQRGEQVLSIRDPIFEVSLNYSTYVPEVEVIDHGQGAACPVEL